MSYSKEGNMIIKPEKQAFTTFIWNSKSKEFLGRTGTSWAKITFFYLIYYGCLAAFFALMLWVFYQTLDTESKPKYTNKDSILSSPALGFRPLASEKFIESTIVYVKTNSTEKGVQKDPTEHPYYEYWSNKLDDFAGGRNFGPCNSANFWGYKADSYNQASPCVIIKLNKMIDWVPNVYTVDNMTKLLDNKQEGVNADDLSEELRNIFKGIIENRIPMIEKVWLSCDGEYPVDRENLHRDGKSGGIELHPDDGFLLSSFPYTGKKDTNFSRPMVAVKFVNPAKNALINVECRIWANGIKHDSKHKIGMVKFELLID